MGSSRNTIIGIGFSIGVLGLLFCTISMLPIPNADDAALHKEIQSEHSYAILQLRRVQLDALAEPAFQILNAIGLAAYLGLIMSLLLVANNKADLFKILISGIAPLAIVRFGLTLLLHGATLATELHFIYITWKAGAMRGDEHAAATHALGVGFIAAFVFSFIVIVGISAAWCAAQIWYCRKAKAILVEQPT